MRFAPCRLLMRYHLQLNETKVKTIKRDFFVKTNLTAFLSMMLFAVCANGQSSIKYFQAEAPVSAQTSAERQKAAAAGLEEVLTRMSGVENVFENPAVVEASDRATRYVEQYHYKERSDEDGGGEALVMTFSPRSIEAVLKQTELPFWPTNRPKTLVWLVEDDLQEGKRLLNSVDHPVVKSLQQYSLQRGVPLIYPLLDMDDQFAISAEAVWNMDETIIKEASQRYGVDTLLVGRLVKNSKDEWLTTWFYVHKGESKLYDFRTESTEFVGVNAIRPLANYLAQRYAVALNAEMEPYIPVQVSSVDQFRDYRGVMDTLSGLAVVNEVSLVSVADSVLLFYLKISGNIEQLKNAIDLDGKLAMQPEEASEYPSFMVPQYSMSQPFQLHWTGR